MGKLKRCLAGFLAVATVLSSSNIAYAAQGITRNGDTDVFSMTAAEAVAIHYELNAEETAVLGNGAILQGVLPDANLPEETLVTVNSIKKTVSAKEYVAENNAYKWVPVSVTTKATDAQETIIDENILFNDPVSGVYTSEKFTADGAYSVHVSYELHYNVTSEEQTRVLGIPAILKDGMSYMSRLEDLRSKLGLFQEEDIFGKVIDARDELLDAFDMTDAEVEELVDEQLAEAKSNGEYDKALEEVKDPSSDLYKYYQEALEKATTPGDSVYEAIYDEVTDKNGDIYKDLKKDAVTPGTSVYNEIHDAVMDKDGSIYKDALNQAKDKTTDLGEAVYDAVMKKDGEIYQEALAQAKDKTTDLGEAVYDAVMKKDGEIYQNALEEAKDPDSSIYQKLLTEAKNEGPRSEKYAEFKTLRDMFYDNLEAEAKEQVKNFPEPKKTELYNRALEEANNYCYGYVDSNDAFVCGFDDDFDEIIEENLGEIIEEKFDDILEENFADIVEEKFDDILEENFADIVEKNFDDILEENFTDIVEENFDTLLENNFASIVEANFETLFDEYIFESVLREILKEEIQDALEEKEQEAQPTVDAINALEADVEDNGLDYWNAITVVDGEKLPFFVNNQAVIRNNSELKARFQTISQFINDNKDLITGYDNVVEELNEIIDELTYFATEKDVTPLKSILATDAAGNIYTSNAEFEALVTALLGEGVVLKSETTTPDATWLKIFAYDVVKAVDAASIEITVRAQAASDIVDDFELVDFEIGKKTIVLAAELKADEIKDQIDAALEVLLNGDDENVGFIEKCAEAGYDVTDDTVYQKPTEFVYPTELVADEKYTCETCYVPKLYKVTNDYMDQQFAYYGTKIQLPNYNGEGNKIYEYKVYDYSYEVPTYESYSQGAVLVVEHDMKIERTEVERTFTRLLGLLPQNHEFETAVKDTILNSSAIKSPLVAISYPSSDIVSSIKTETADDGENAVVTHYAVAPYVNTGIDGMVWIPTGAVLAKLGADGAEEIVSSVNITGVENEEETAVVYRWVPGDVDYDYLKVNYELMIKTILEDNKYVNLDANKLLGYLNLAKDVVAEVNTHKTILEDKIDLVYTNITGNLKTVMNTAVLKEVSGKLTDGEGKGNEAVAAILAANKGDKLNLYTYLEASCPDPEAQVRVFDVAGYLYNGYYAKLREEAVFLAPHLRAIAGDEKLGEVLSSYGVTVDDALRRQIYDFAEKLDGIKVEANGTLTDTKTGGLKNTIKDLSDNILVEDQVQFTTLINGIVENIIDKNITVKGFTAADAAKGAVAKWSGTTDAPGKASITISAVAPNGEAVSGVYSFSVNDEATSYTLNSTDAEKIAALYDSVKAQAGITVDNAIYYIETPKAEETLPVEGDTLSFESGKAFYYSYSYTAKEYEEPIIAKGEQVDLVKFTGSDVTPAIIVLPALTDNNEYKYVYTITEIVDGKEVVTTVDCANGNGTYTVKNLKDIALGNDTLKIVRSKYSLETVKIDLIVNAFNDGLKDSGASFVKVKDYTGEADNGIYKAIVMSMDADMKTEELLPAFGSAMVNVAFETDYIGFGAEGKDAFLTRDEEKGTQIQMQALINLLLNSDISLKKLAEMTDANGTILDDKNVKFDAAYTVDNNGKALGAELVKSGIKFDENGKALPFYITMTSENSETLKSLKNAQGSYGNNISVGTKEGTLTLDATMPEKVFTLYMSVMLMTGVITEEDLAGVDPSLEEQIKLLKKELELDFLGEVNYEVIENTIDTFLYGGEDKTDLEPYGAVIDSIIKTVNGILSDEDGVHNGNPTIERTKSEGGQYAFNMTYDIADMLATVEGIGDFVGFLGENTKIKIPMSFTVLNISAGVEAIILDWSQSGLDKLQYIDNVAEYLNAEQNTTGPVYVYLLEDIGAALGFEELNINVPTILNLNGHTVLTDIQANAALRIVDSELNASEEEMGSVYGKIFGDNVRIGGGRYPLYDPSHELYVGHKIPASMIREGYTQDGDRVINEYFTVSKDEVTKTINVAMSTRLAESLQSDVQTLALDMLADVVFNVYTVGKVAVDGNTLFAADTNALLDNFTGLENVAKKLSECVNVENMKTFTKDFYAKFADLGELANKVQYGGEVASFDLTTADWGVKARLVGEEGNKYIGLDLATDKEETYKVRFYFKDQNPELAETLRTAKELVTVNRSFSYEGIEINGTGVNIKGSLVLEVLLDFTQNLENDPQKSSDYVTAMAAILAYSLDEGEERDRLIAAIVDYENDIYVGALEDEFNKLTVRQLIDAIKTARDTELSFEEILKELGLRNLLSDTIGVAACYTSLLEIAYSLVTYIETVLDTMDNAQDRFEIYENSLGSERIMQIDKVVDPETGKTLYVKTYGGGVDTPYGKALTLDLRMKLFSEYHVPPVDEAIYALNELPELDEIYKVDADGNVIVDNREAYIPVVSGARAAYDKLSESLKYYVPSDLYEKLVAIEDMYNSWGVWVASIDDVNYTGTAHKPEVHVYDGAKLLTIKDDYTVSYQFNVNAADKDSEKAPRVVVKLRKNYAGTVYSYFTIHQIDLVKAYNDPEYAAEVGVKIDDVYAAATTSKKTTNFVKPVVYLNGKKVSTSEYGLYYNDNPTSDKKSENYKQVGSAYPITVYGKNKNFKAEFTTDAKGKAVIDTTVGYTVYQHVASYLMSKVSVAGIANQYYTGKEIVLETSVYGNEPLVADKKNNSKLVVTFKSGKNVMHLYEGVHFYANYENNVDVGTVTVNLLGTGMSEKTYVEEYNLKHPTEMIQEPEGGFDTRSFTGTKTIKFKIVASKKLTSAMVTMLTLQEVDGVMVPTPLKKGAVTKEYTGYEIVLENGFDYVVEATVNKLDEEGNVIFGDNKKPLTEKVALAEDTDYQVTYKKNLNKGTATVTFKGIGNYAGTVNKSFKINAAPINNLLISDPEIQVAYQKSGVKPVSEIILKNSNTRQVLVNNKDYALSFANAAKVAVYNDELGKYVYENPKAVAGERIIDREGINERLLAADPEKPVTKAELTVANKYMPRVIVSGKGNYTGKITLYYAITPVSLKEAGVTITAKDVKYSTKNNNWTTSVTLKDVNGKTLGRNTDYSKDYEYFVKDTKTKQFVPVESLTDKKLPAGSQMKVKVKGINNYAGENSYLEAIYYIHKESINTSKVTITWDAFDTTYDKYEKKPANIKVTYKQSKTAPRDLVKDTDYEILATNYKQNTFVGTAKITIKGIGEFTGTKTKTFRILQFKQNRVDLSKGSVLLDHDIIVDYQKGGVKPAGEVQLTYKHPAYMQPLSLKEGRDYKLTWYNTGKVATYYDVEDGEYVYGYINRAKEFVEVKVPDKSLAVTNAKEYKKQVTEANKYMPRVRITGLGNYSGYMDVYYKIEPENLAEVAKLTAKDLNWSNKNTNYRTSVVVKDGNGKTLAVNTDYKLNYYIETFEREKPETSIYKLINECLGTKVIVGYKNGNPVEVEINAKGKIVLTEKGQEVTMKAVAYGVNAYGVLDSESFVIDDEFIIKR